MKILKFKLSGKSAFFKKPDVNSYLYFTYGNIHKVALLGLFGAIIGYGGYNSMNIKSIFADKKNKKNIDFPQFYEKLQNIKISIEPLNSKGFIPKKVQSFNNSVGYASKEQGGNLIVKEQWLENPAWNIYLIVDDEESSKIAQYITTKKAVYSPYLGKNDHYADITEVKIFEENDFKLLKDTDALNSLYLKKDFALNSSDDDFFDFDDDNSEEKYKYEEKLPVALEKTTNIYIMESFVYTNMNIKKCSDIDVYEVDNKRIVFY